MDCSSLTSLTIGNSVTSIGGGAFFRCHGLTSVTAKSTVPPTLDPNAYTFSHYGTLYVPMGCAQSYKASLWNKNFTNFIEIQIPAEDGFAMNAFGMSTYSSSHALDFTEVEGLKAYIASGFSPSTGVLTLTRVYQVPAGEGLVLKGETGDYDIPNCETDMFYSNLLKGVPIATNVAPTEGLYTNFILANGKYGVSFYTLTEAGEIASGKAYLQLPTSAVSALSREMKVVFGDDEDNDATTGVVELKSPNDVNSSAGVFDLQGRRMPVNVKRGLYIMNGKNVMIK